MQSTCIVPEIENVSSSHVSMTVSETGVQFASTLCPGPGVEHEPQVESALHDGSAASNGAKKGPAQTHEVLSALGTA